jgi:hypothetical protein
VVFFVFYFIINSISTKIKISSKYDNKEGNFSDPAHTKKNVGQKLGARLS